MKRALFKKRVRPLSRVSLVAAAALVLAGGVRGANDTWVGNTSGNWADPNWTGGNNPPVDGDALFFGIAGTFGAFLTNNLTPGFSVAGITFNAGASAYTFTGSALTLNGNVLNSSTSLETINLDLALTAQRTFTTTTGGGNLSLGGVLSGAGGVSKAGVGNLNILGTANTYTGETIFGTGGIVNVASLSDYGVAGSLGARTEALENNTPTGISLHFTGGTLQYTGSTPQSTNRQIRILNGAGATIDASGSTPTATLSFTHTGANINLFDTGGTRTLTLTGINTGNNSFSIQLTDQATNQTSLQKTGTGTWLLPNSDNTYTGETLFAGGILNVASVSDYGVASSIGSRAFAQENTTVTGVSLHFRGGTLQYTGSTPQSTNRNIRVLNGNGGTIDASGSTPAATLSFTHTGANMNLFDTGGIRTLTLTGTNVGENGFSILLADQALSPTSLSKTGTGTWVLNGPDTNQATGLTSVTNGMLVLDKTNAVAVSGTLSIGGGVGNAVLKIRGTGGNQIADTIIPTLSGIGSAAGILRMNNFTETMAGISSGGGGGIVENESGASGTGTLVLNVSAAPIFSGVLRDGDGVGIDGQLAITKIGNGTLTLSGSSTHTGPTAVNAGTLSVTGILTGTTVSVSNATLNGTGTINGPVNINSSGQVGGALTTTALVTIGSGGTLGGTGSMNGGVSLLAGGHLSPATATTPGTLNASTLTLANGSFLDLEFGGTSDLINVTSSGGLAINGGALNLFATGGVAPLTANGTYTLLDYNTNFTGALGNLTIGNSQVGKFYSINNDTTNTLLTLTIGDATVTEWNGGAANGLWSASGNWTLGVPNSPGAVAKFGTIPASPTTVAVNGAKVVGGILFDNPNSYTITGTAADAITLNNGVAAASIAVNSGNHEIAAPIILATNALSTTANGTLLLLSGNISGTGSFTASGTGTTTLTGTNSFTTTNVNGGTLQIGNGGNTGTVGSGDVTVASGATLIFNRGNNLTVNNNLLGAAGQITKLGAGTLTLGGNNTFGTGTGGRLNVNAGTVKASSASALPSGLLLSFANGTLDLSGNDLNVGSLSGTGGVLTDSGATAGTTTLTLSQIDTTTFGGAITNGTNRILAINKTGIGTVTLSGNNTFSGPLAINSGAVIAAATNGTPALSTAVSLGNSTTDVYLIAGSATPQFGPNTVVNFTNAGKNAKFLLRGTSQTVAGLDSTADPSVSLAIVENDETIAPGYTTPPGAATLTINAVADHSFAGLIRNQTGGALDIVKEGPATQEIRNILVTSDNFGNITVNNGKLSINFVPNANNTNILGAATFVTVNSGGTLGLDGSWTMTRPISGAGNIIKQGTGTVTLNGANSFTGTLLLSQGVLAASTAGGTALPGNVTIGNGAQSNIFLVMGAANQFGPNSVLTFNNGFGNDAKFELRGFAQTVAGLSSDADDTLSIIQNQESGAPAAVTLTINNTSDYVFNGLIRAQTGGAVSLFKTGPGTQEIRNIAAQADNFALLTIDQGKFVINHSGATASLGAATTVVINAAGTLGLDGAWDMNRPISGAGGVVKQGGGTVTISVTDSYGGPTNINGGTLLVTGSISASSSVNIAGSATLGGTGTVGPVVVADNGIVAPGVNGPGVLITGNFSLNPSSLLFFDLSDANGLNDRLVAGGNLTLDGTLFINPAPTFNEGTYRIFDYAGGLTNHTLDIDPSILAAFPGSYIDVNTLGQVNLVVAIVPEPTSAAFLVGSLGLMAFLRRNRKPTA